MEDKKMKFNCDFSYRHYLEVLNYAKKTYKIGPIRDYNSLKKNKKFILLRHDVDFSLIHALELAKIEAKKRTKVLKSFLSELKHEIYIKN